MEKARAWHSDLLGTTPYFERSGPGGQLVHAEFRVGDYQHELGLIDRRYAPARSTAGPGGAVMKINGLAVITGYTETAAVKA
ncbi:hypothetical protein D3C87_740100 [compost metagenome]